MMVLMWYKDLPMFQQALWAVRAAQEAARRVRGGLVTVKIKDVFALYYGVYGKKDDRPWGDVVVAAFWLKKLCLMLKGPICGRPTPRGSIYVMPKAPLLAERPEDMANKLLAWLPPRGREKDDGPMRLITVHVSKDILETVDELVRKGLYPTRSHVIRAALYQYLRNMRI